MKKMVGIVSEGPTDYMVIKEVIDHISGEENDYIRLQPEPDMKGEFGNGWKGVWKWCEESGEHLEQLFNGIIPRMDLLIVQMDADVARTEKEVHCFCEGRECNESGVIHPLQCRKLFDQTVAES